MKCQYLLLLRLPLLVTLYVRVWIEIFKSPTVTPNDLVTLYVRVWIEIACNLRHIWQSVRHPLREGVD